MRPILIWTAALVAAACGSPETPSGTDGPADVLRQTLGEGRPLRVTEELRIEGVGEESSFYLIRAVARDDAGRIYVLDAGNDRIVVFDASGRPVRAFGREGQGPGEFESPLSMWLARDTLAVGDRANRLHFFLTDGTHVRTRAFLDMVEGVELWRTGSVVGTPEGWLLTASAFFRTDAQGRQNTLAPGLRMRLFEVGAGGDLEPTGLYWERESEGRWDGVYWVQAPFEHNPLAAVDGLGRLHVAATGEYAIDVYDAGGRRVGRVENEVPRIPIDGAMLDRWREVRACRPERPACSEARTELALSLPRDEFVPVVGAIRGFPGGYTAVRRAATDPDPSDQIVLGDYDFFAPDGTYMGTLEAGSSPQWFDGEVLLAVEWDEMDVPSVVRYRADATTGRR